MNVLKGRELREEVAMEIRADTTMMHHDGGTKFYEVIRIFNEGGKRFVVVNRWGKMSERRGGQSKVENFGSAGIANVAAAKKINEKRKRGYNEVIVRDVLPGSFDGDLIRLKLNECFDDSDTVELIMSGLGISDVLTGASGKTFEPDDVVVEEPEPEVERGEEWASW